MFFDKGMESNEHKDLIKASVKRFKSYYTLGAGNKIPDAVAIDNGRLVLIEALRRKREAEERAHALIEFRNFKKSNKGGKVVLVVITPRGIMHNEEEVEAIYGVHKTKTRILEYLKNNTAGPKKISEDLGLKYVTTNVALRGLLREQLIKRIEGVPYSKYTAQ